jgi:hypothetical protein
MRLLRTVVVEKPLGPVFDYLSDFTTTTQWDPGTLTTVRQHGNRGIGTTYLNTSTFLGRKTRLTYVVDELWTANSFDFAERTRPSWPLTP